MYLASLDALRHGDELGKDVFASQPPGFYLLLRFVAVFAGRSIENIRIGMLVVALIGVAAAFVIGRVVARRAGALAAAALVVAGPPFAANAARVEADAPSIALALVSLAIAARFLRPRGTLGALCAGAMAALAVSVKFLALPVVVPLVVLAVQRRVGARAAIAMAAGATVVAGAFLIGYATVLPDLWRDAVLFHRHARAVTTGQSSAKHVADYFAVRTPTTWAALVGFAVALVFRRQLALWSWVAAALLFLLAQTPLLDHHFVLLAAALGTAAGASLGSVPGRYSLLALAAAGVIAIGGWIQDYRQIQRGVQPEPAEVRQAAAYLRATTAPNDLVASDLPVVPYLAGRREPGALVDTSAVRFASGSLDARDVRRANARVYVAGREFLRERGTLAGLTLVRRFGGIEIFRRP